MKATKAQIMEKAKAKREKAYELRQQGKTFREIGEFLGVCAPRARSLVIHQERIIANAIYRESMGE